MVTPLDKLGELLVELLNVLFLSFQVDLIAPGHSFKPWEIGYEFLKYPVTNAEYLDRIHSLQCYGFLH